MEQDNRQAVPGRKIAYSEKTSQFFITFPYDFNLKEVLKATLPGWFWDKESMRWTIPAKPSIIAPLLAFALKFGFTLDEAAKDYVEKCRQLQADPAAYFEAKAKSLSISGLGGELRQYQKVAVTYALEKRQLFICDEMGIGKTIEALATIQAANAYPALVICPAVVKLNWQREVTHWLPGKKAIVLNGKQVAKIDEGDIVIVNYDILSAWLPVLMSTPFKTIVLDESHYIKDGKSKRAKCVMELVKGKPYRIALSGTPVVNRPADLIPQLKALGLLELMGGFVEFAKRYCNRKKIFGRWDISGASNLDELNKRLQDVGYIRRQKSEVLLDLSPLQRTIIPVESQGSRKQYKQVMKTVITCLKEKQTESCFESDADLEAENCKEGSMHILALLEKLKQEAAHIKLPAIIEWAKDYMATGQKLVIFAIHHEIINGLVDELGPKWQTICITGKTLPAERDHLIDQFQNNSEVRILVANIRAMGLGVSLTASSNVVFAELDWTSTAHDQAEARCHRSGQSQMVNAYYFLAEQTIDEDIFDIMTNKRKIIERATDGLGNKVVTSVINELKDRLMGCNEIG